MQVTLLNQPTLDICDLAISKCWMKEAKDPIARMERVILKHKHASTAEHIIYQFDIEGVSRALLQELARHRIASPTVKSSRYTLGELKNLPPMLDLGSHGEENITPEAIDRCSQFIVLTGIFEVDSASCRALYTLQLLVQAGISNDKVKYCMPEAYRTSLVLTINARSLQNLLSLRSAPSALWEFRDLANAMFDCIPVDQQFLFTDCMKGN
ncbi:MAG: FAD-dependent thymidylate synthase [Campylobacterota bacterium]|nr:FAD-dependent thymidylate synthase [Campylobacterota bacterium]